jgi:hypothetical protein
MANEDNILVPDVEEGQKEPVADVVCVIGGGYGDVAPMLGRRAVEAPKPALWRRCRR